MSVLHDHIAFGAHSGDAHDGVACHAREATDHRGAERGDVAGLAALGHQFAQQVVAQAARHATVKRIQGQSQRWSDHERTLVDIAREDTRRQQLHADAVRGARGQRHPGTRVLLPEAGPRERSPWIHLPIGGGKTRGGDKVNWGSETDPEPNMNGRRIYGRRGKTLGGSSSINGLIYLQRSATPGGAPQTSHPAASSPKAMRAARFHRTVAACHRRYRTLVRSTN